MPNHEPIAITGIGCRFPGGADGPEAFWNLLRSGTDAITEIPPDRWNVATYYDAEPGLPGRTNSRWGGFIAGIDRFDPAFFGISPREAACMDPQQRLLLETAWESIEDAGIVADPAAGSDTGVFVGISTHDYSQIQTSFGDKTTIETHSTTGTVLSIAANRISYLLNFRGPSFAVDTACSSSLVAVHLACRSLANGECQTALAGGVNAILVPDTFIGFSKMSMLSPDGRCMAFDARANGFVRGEGAGVIVLRPLSAALADGDRIYAVIRGSAVNQDGRTSSLTVPGLEAQKRLILEACRDAGIDPHAVDYVEAHGTGTPVGDPIEAAAIGAVVGEHRTGQACVIGSVKTNIGHLEAGSGIAGIIKAALALHHGEVPPNLHFVEPNPNIDFKKWNLHVPVALEILPHKDAVAGINSFGFGGTNAHVILQSAPRQIREAAGEPPGTNLLVLSARDAEGLREIASQYAAWLATCGEPLENICHTLATRRPHHPHRLAIASDTKPDVAEKLDAFLAGECRAGLSSGVASETEKIAFVFTGQGPQWWAMGRELLAGDQGFRETIAECDALFRRWGDWSLMEELSRDEAGSLIDRPAIAQPAIFALQIALAAWWRAHGIEPGAVIGHSVGEAAAAHLSGALDLATAAKVIFERGRCMQSLPPTGRMLAVALSPEAAAPWLAGFEKRAEIGAVNSPRSVVFSGEPAALEKIARKLEAAGIWRRFLRVGYAFHSAQMDPVKSTLKAALRGISSRTPALPICSSVTAKISRAEKFDAEYWWRNVRQPVRFAEAIRTLIEAGFTTFLEIGPHPALSGSVSECLKAGGVDGFVTGSLRRGEPEAAALVGSLGALHVRGIPIRWNTGGRCAALPLHPWRHERYWHEAGASGATRLGPPPHPLLGRALNTADPVWTSRLRMELLPYLDDHRLNERGVFPAAAYVEMALGAGRQLHDASALVLEDIEFHRALFLPAQEQAMHLEFRCSADDGAFRIHAQSGAGRSWTAHCSGKIRAAAGAPPPPPALIAEIMTRCSEERPAGEIYGEFENSGFQFGEAFRCLSRVWRRDGEALGEICAPASLRREGYVFHPAILDACFQVLSSALPADAATRRMYLPVGIGRMRYFARTDGKIWSHASVREAGESAVTADFCLFDGSGRVLAVIDAFRCAATDQPAARPGAHDECFYEIRWKEAEPNGANLADVERASRLLFPLQTGNRDGRPTSKNRLELTPFSTEPEPPQADGGAWLLIGGGSALANDITSQLEAEGDFCAIADGHTDIDLSGSPKISHVVYLAEPSGDDEAVSAYRLCSELIGIARMLAAPRGEVRLSVVTRGAQPVDATPPSAAQGALAGLARVLMNESPGLNCRIIDLCAGDHPIGTDALVAELRSSSEEEVALRGARRLVSRLVRSSPKPAGLSGRKTPFRLEIVKAGGFDQIEFRRLARRPPAADEVEVEVIAAALNFRDVMKVLGIYPIEQPDDQLLGDECAGTVVAVGREVTDLVEGDDVIVIAPGCFSKYVTARAAFVVRKPSSISLVDAAAIPVAFLTAHYALNHLARIGRGERVLIHAAAGGVGLAALQIARLAGAEIFATAGNDQKRDLVRRMGAAHVMDSRSLDFADEVMDATGGRGVDVVLNSLSGEAIPKSFSVLAPYGRFLEIGKRDIYQNSRLGMRQFSRNISFFAIDLARLLRDRPPFVAQMIADLIRKFEARDLAPLPQTVYPIERAADAFREMAQGRHSGKIVFMLDATNVRVRPDPGERFPFRPDATYLVTGGVRGFGLAIAEWMIGRGARNLALAGASETSARAAKEILARHIAGGVNIVTAAVDVSDESALAGFLSRIQSPMPPLRGIVHAAVKMDDCLLEDLTPTRLAGVLGPKAAGAWNLHSQTRDMPLDFFVMTSSVSSLIGNPGQGSYAAANAFLDTLAHHRRALGLPALAINWGHLGEVGHASRNADVSRHLERYGVAPLCLDEALVMLERLLLSDSAAAAAIRIDWKQWAEANPRFKKYFRYEEVIPSGLAANPNEGFPGGVAAAILSASGTERVRLLENFIREVAARVLGLPATKLNATQPLSDAGLDSLMGIELVNRIEDGLGTRFPVEKLLGGPSIQALAKILDESLPSPAASGK